MLEDITKGSRDYIILCQLLLIYNQRGYDIYIQNVYINYGAFIKNTARSYHILKGRYKISYSVFESF